MLLNQQMPSPSRCIPEDPIKGRVVWGWHLGLWNGCSDAQITKAQGNDLPGVGDEPDRETRNKIGDGFPRVHSMSYSLPTSNQPFFLIEGSILQDANLRNNLS